MPNKGTVQVTAFTAPGQAYDSVVVAGAGSAWFAARVKLRIGPPPGSMGSIGLLVSSVLTCPDVVSTATMPRQPPCPPQEDSSRRPKMRLPSGQVSTDDTNN